MTVVVVEDGLRNNMPSVNLQQKSRGFFFPSPSKKTTCPTSSSFRMCRSFKNKPSIRSLSRFSFYEKIWRTFSILLCTCEEYIVRVKLYYLTVVISKYVFLSILSFFADNLHIMMTGSPLQSLLYASLLWLDSLLGI